MTTVLFYGNMAEKALIVAVSGYPEFYNISSSDYHNLFLKKKSLERNISVTEYNCRYFITSQKHVSRPSRSSLRFF